MARHLGKIASNTEFLEDDGSDKPPENLAQGEITDADTAGVQGDDQLPPVTPEEPETDTAAAPPPSPPPGTAQPDPAQPPPLAAEVPEPKRPTWKMLKEAEKQAELHRAQSEQLQQERAAWQQEQQRLMQEAANLRAWQTQQAELARQHQEQQLRAQQGPWTPETGRQPTQQELQQYYEQDPIGYNNYVNWTTQQQLIAYQQQTQQVLQQQALQREVERDQENFRRQEPHYDEALNFLAEHERATARALKLNEQEWIDFRASQLVQLARQNNLSVASAAWQLASDWGYKPADPAQAGAAPAPNPALERVRQSQLASQASSASLGRTGGTVAARGTITTQDYLKMTDEEIEEMDRIHGVGWEDKMVQ